MLLARKYSRSLSPARGLRAIRAPWPFRDSMLSKAPVSLERSNSTRVPWKRRWRSRKSSQRTRYVGQYFLRGLVMEPFVVFVEGGAADELFCFLAASPFFLEASVCFLAGFFCFLAPSFCFFKAQQQGLHIFLVHHC